MTLSTCLADLNRSDSAAPEVVFKQAVVGKLMVMNDGEKRSQAEKKYGRTV